MPDADDSPNSEELTAPQPWPSVRQLLPIAGLDALTPEEREDADRLQIALNVIGPAAGGCLVCPGNQIDVPDDRKCPYSAKCVLLRARKAPAGHLCPIEAEAIASSFERWASEASKNPVAMTASERSFVAEMVWIDTEENRCTAIVSKGEDARLTQINTKETMPETGQILSWEKVIHANVLRLDTLSLRRRLRLRDMLLTPDTKAKAERWLQGNKKGEEDLSSQQSARADRLRDLGTVIDAEPT